MRASKDPLMRESKRYKLSQKDAGFLLRAVQERASANKKPEIKWGNQAAHLPYDLIFKILLLLPAESLHRSSFVCKAWFNLINSPDFIEAHMGQSETVLIFLQSVPERRPKTFSIEAKLAPSKHDSIFLTNEAPKPYINFLEVEDGMGKVSESNISGCKDILATCNGLILAKCELNRGLLVMNPATRKLVGLPLGTIVPRDESYGFVFSHLTREYKVVHLFRDESGYIGCEILSLNRKSWWAVDGPSLGLLRRFIYKPVSAIGALHWLPAKHDCNYLVSMGIDDGFPFSHDNALNSLSLSLSPRFSSLKLSSNMDTMVSNPTILLARPFTPVRTVASTINLHSTSLFTPSPEKLVLRCRKLGLGFRSSSSFRSKSVITCGVTEINERQFSEVVLNSDRPVLVEFVANWCGPCRLISPAIEWVSQEYKEKLMVVKIDHDSNPRLIEEFKVYGLPTLIFFKNGHEVPESRREGAITKAKLKEYVDALLESVSLT